MSHLHAMDSEEHIERSRARRRELHRIRRDRKTSEKEMRVDVEIENICDVEELQ